MGGGITPAALQEGNTIALVSPSYRMNDKFAARLDRASKYLEAQGFYVRNIFDANEPSDYQAKISHICEEIHQAFREPSIKAIVCTIGGGGAHELLSSLDYDLIRANPKIFCGYSDSTVLHCALFSQTGLRTFYGPTAIVELGEDPEPVPFISQSFLRMLTKAGCEPLGQVPVSETWIPSPWGFFNDPERKAITLETRRNDGWAWLKPGKAKGRILGGAINPLMHLPGTKFWPDFTNCVLLLETSLGTNINEGKPLGQVQEQMTHLRNMGVFNIITGLVYGRAYGYNNDQKAQLDQIILDQTRGCDFPILTNVDVGHTWPKITIPFNALVHLDSDRNTFEILEPSVAPP